MRIFITGGSGFIGIHLCKKLLNQNHEITVYDNFSNSSQKNFLSKIDDNVNLISGDILDYSLLVNSMNNHDVVIHLAAKISVSESIKNPELTFDVNVNGTANVLKACVKNNISKIIATSTAAVYQNISEKIILTESSDVIPSSPYGQSKLEMEKIITVFAQTSNVNAIILRLFNVYGVGQSSEYAGVITKFLENIENNDKLTIFGDGSQTRDFVYVEDVVDAIILSLHSTNFGIYNIASGNSISVLELANLFNTLFNKNLKLLFSSSQKGDIKFSSTLIHNAKKYLHFSPKFDIVKGLKKLSNS